MEQDALRALAADHWGLEIAPTSADTLVGYEDLNLRLGDSAGRQYVLKVAAAKVKPESITLQHRVLRHLARTVPEAPLPRVITTRAGEDVVTVNGDDGVPRLARLLTYLPGRLMADGSPHGPAVLRRFGHLLGEVDRALGTFDDPAARYFMDWDVAQAADLRAGVPLVEEPVRRQVTAVLDRFDSFVAPLLPHLPHSIIHADANDYNVLLETDATGEAHIAGLIDFGDVVRTATVCEPAVALAAGVLFGQEDPIAAASAFVAGYHARRPLGDAELDVLFDLARVRLAMSIVRAAEAAVENPDNAYCQISAAPSRCLLDTLDALDPVVVRDALGRACPSPRGTTISPDTIADLTRRRERHLSPSLSLSYREPLEIVRGSGPYLFDRDGRAHLDCVNNVCHVGHAHPAVVEALNAQAARLNTNTRYLYGALSDYAERLVATLPDPLSVCFFACSGSEANELALRLARTHTGREDVVVLDGAYHGNTASMVAMSPYKYEGPGGAGRVPWVHAVAMPDPYRGPHGSDDPKAGSRYADSVADAVEKASRAGRPPAAFFAESMLGCGGQIVLPPGYLHHAFAHVRAAGGVCVADEVQVGFGRAGSHFWAFETQDVVPDIVTLGKPIGNGHPMAAVVTTPEIAKSFANGMEYFNTFGGNPVSCSVGLAVLDVIEREGLQANALETGRHLLDGLQGLASRHALIGDVRGHGLFIGVELVRSRETLEPAAAEANAVVEHAKARHQVLLSTDGPLHNVLKIKPPIVLGRHHADRVIEAIDAALALS